MKGQLVFFLVLLLSIASNASQRGGVPLPIHLLRPQSGSGGDCIDGVTCDSWRLGVETNNVQGWTTVPSSCEDYVGHYMLGDRYRKDFEVVTTVAGNYAVNLTLAGDGKDAWIFDIDETTLSNLPYYAKHGFGAQPYNSTLFNAWVLTGEAPALPESLKLYNKLVSLGFKIIFLTGRPESQRNITTENLKKEGYHTWEKLILKGTSDSGKTALVYKSGKRGELVEEGYILHGSMGDQWSDLLGTNTGNRTFKAPDPMYYLS